MRYFNQTDIVFIDKDGISYQIKETRKIESLATAIDISINEGDTLDEIATRRNILGDNAEHLIYKIFDHNIVEIVEAGYDLDKMKSLRIPAI